MFASTQGLEDVLENGPYMIRNVPIVLKKWSPNVSLSKEDLKKGWGCFARALIELDATCRLKDKLVVAIPMSEGSASNKPTNGSYRQVVKPKSNTLVSNSFSALEEDNGNFMDELADDTRKKVKAPPRKTGIWSGWKAERNIDFSHETERYNFDRDCSEFVNMNQVVEVV
ncbi:phosphonates import ATP-binding protein like protein [Tanacetum coccineum]